MKNIFCLLSVLLIFASTAQANKQLCPKPGTHYFYGLLNYSNCLEGFSLDEAIMDEDRKEYSYCISNVKDANDGERTGAEYLAFLIDNGSSGFIDFCATIDAAKTEIRFTNWPVLKHAPLKSNLKKGTR